MLIYGIYLMSLRVNIFTVRNTKYYNNLILLHFRIHPLITELNHLPCPTPRYSPLSRMFAIKISLSVVILNRPRKFWQWKRHQIGDGIARERKGTWIYLLPGTYQLTTFQFLFLRRYRKRILLCMVSKKGESKSATLQLFYSVTQTRVW